MEQGNTAVADNGSVLKTGWICLIIGFVLFLLPIPLFGLGLLVAGGLCTAALVMSIIGMSKGFGGLGLLLTSLIGTPIVYFLSFFTWMYSLT